MARLNESTAPVEPIEALKRRFVRQNREIARVNSIQSLRIRSLESEVSHFLSENVSLREQVISLTQEIERYEAVKSLQDGVNEIKAKLDDKLMELDQLVTELGTLPRTFCNRLGEKSLSIDRKKPTQSILDWRSKTTDRDPNVANDEGGGLPVILEDKCYPRRTLEPQELQATTEGGSEPNISFDQEKPRSLQQHAGDDDPFSARPQHFNYPQRLGYGATMLDEDEAFLPPTFETRKRKTHNPAHGDLQTHEMHSESSKGQDDSEVRLNRGAKRKFSVHHKEELESALMQEEGPQFNQRSRPPSTTARQSSSPYVDDSTSEGKIQPSKEGTSIYRQAKRKVLEYKSTNVTMSTPQKEFTTGMQEPVYKISVNSPSNAVDGKGGTHYAQPEAGINHENCIASGQDGDEGTRETGESNEAAKVSKSLAKKPELQSSTTDIASRDEPKAMADVLSSTARPARRQRAIVSYAEPNLRHKMRRPTNNLIAAVGENQTRRTSHPRSARADTNDDEDGHNNWKMNVQRQRGKSDCTGRDLQSPSIDALSSSSAMNMVSQRKRKTSPASRSGDLSPQIITETTEDHSSVFQADKSSHERSGDKNDEETQLPQILDHKLRRPPNNSCKSRKITSRQPRRHSSNPDSSEQRALHSINSVTLGIETHLSSPSKGCAEVAFPKSVKNSLKLDSHTPALAENTQIHLPSINTEESRRGRRVAAAAARRKSMML
ncbi:hypothetical protein BO71DRAFT_445227 [Aspergillus ellipticus CBS 707.79]|uniref:Shugoshin C terminal domain protein n=1 Tax=Aspergillus ellipticus CBS 707.79 TaxID=1448320 RepID=A0A319EBI2_9EURO|nr:hypothetical protein BO71DRAFT_445227 [Aspergillus ellipticus CBS 707.79]